LLEAVLAQQARLISHWQSIGFIHGVMNTDNASVAGLTIDYGPCAFMDSYHPQTVFSSIDHGNRYAYQNQPGIGQWNCANLAQCLLPLIDTNEEQSLTAAQAVIDSFPDVFEKEYLLRFRHKLGLQSEQDEDAALISDLLKIMADAKVDFTNTFRALSHSQFESGATGAKQANGAAAVQVENLFAEPEAITGWLEQWRARHRVESGDPAQRRVIMRESNPAYIPRNHQIEKIISAAMENDYAPMHTLSKLLDNPYTEQADMEQYARPPEQHEIVQATFCGT